MTADLRIGDAERNAAVTALGEHFAAGRLDKEEFDERTATAWAARTSGDLAPLFVDLPSPHAPPVESADPGSPARSDRTHRGSWVGLARFAVVVPIVALAVALQISWFVVALVIWVCCVGTARSHRRRARPPVWIHHRPYHPWRPPVRR
ncbi:MAG: DUF1707 SHOCT-like domain-containing protein [Nocardioidaceae bacterium]